MSRVTEIIVIAGNDTALLQELEVRGLLRGLVDEVLGGPVVIDIAPPPRPRLIEPLVRGIAEQLASLDLSFPLEDMRLESRSISPKQLFEPPPETRREMFKRLRGNNRHQKRSRH